MADPGGEFIVKRICSTGPALWPSRPTHYGDGAAPCSVAESLRPSSDDAEVGLETAPQDSQAGETC